MSDRARDWIFTFGVDHPLGKCFVRIHGTDHEAREEMVRRYGLKWAFQYKTEDEAGTQKYHLTEIPDAGGR